VSAHLLKPIRQSEFREAIARVVGAHEQEGPIPLITRFSLQDARGPAAFLCELLAEDNPFTFALFRKHLIIEPTVAFKTVR
jgi:hypothetical protein